MSLSSTTTCQECSRSFKDFQGLSCGEKNHDPDHLPGVFKVLQLSTKRVPLLFKSLFFETSIMNHFQITKPNKSITNPRTKLKPNPKWFAPQSYEPTPADVSRSRFAARRSFAEVPDQTHQQGRGPCKVIMMLVMMLFWRLSSDIAALSR